MIIIKKAIVIFTAFVIAGCGTVIKQVNQTSYQQVTYDIIVESNDIQSAVDRAIDGQTIFIPAGSYQATSSALAVIDKSVILIGEGDNTVIDAGVYGTSLDNSGLGNNWVRAFVILTDNVTFKNIKIKGFQGDGSSNGGYAIVARANSSWASKNETIDGLQIENVTFEDCLYGIRAENAVDLQVINCDFQVDTGTNDYSLYITSSNRTLIQGNDLYQGGIWLTAAKNCLVGGDYNWQSNNLLDIQYNGIWYGFQFGAGTSSTQGTIKNNYLTGCQEGGIVLWNENGESGENIQIIGNTLVNIVGSGGENHGAITMVGGNFSDISILSNIITNNAHGIKINDLWGWTPQIDGLNISENDIFNNSSNGIYIDNTSSIASTEIKYNNIYNNSSYDLNNSNATTVNAEYNWWGDVSGPVNNTGKIDSVPFLTEKRS